MGGYFQEDEEEVVLATRLAVHGPIVGPQASFPGIGAPSFSGQWGKNGPSRMLPTAARPNDPSGPANLLGQINQFPPILNDPSGPVNLLGPLSDTAGPYSGLFTGTRWKPFPEVPPSISPNHLHHQL